MFSTVLVSVSISRLKMSLCFFLKYDESHRTNLAFGLDAQFLPSASGHGHIHAYWAVIHVYVLNVY